MISEGGFVVAVFIWRLLSPGDLSVAYTPRTRKMCYHKDDRAMRPIYGCHENFRDSLTTPMAIFSKIFHGLLF